MDKYNAKSGNYVSSYRDVFTNIRIGQKVGT